MINSSAKSRLKFVGVAVASVSFGLFNIPAQASTFTRTSPTSGGTLPSGVSEIGGIVVDLIGTNGTRVVTQTPASSLYVGYAGSNPLTFGTQSGFTPAVIGTLGGGISQAAVRISLYDGDSASGNFDYNENTLLLNGINFGDFSSVQTQNTDANGVELAAGLSGGGFRDDLLDTGFFLSNNSTTLSQLYASLSIGSINFGLNDVDPYDNYFDFTQGISSAFVNVGTGPVITPGNPTAVPEPFTVIGTLMGSAAAFRMRQRFKATNKL